VADIKITPGSAGAAICAVQLFGRERVEPGVWASPVTVKDLSAEEVAFAKEFFTEQDLVVRVLNEGERGRT